MFSKILNDVYNWFDTNIKLQTSSNQEMIAKHRLYQQGQYILMDISPADQNQFWNKKYISARTNVIWQMYGEHIEKVCEYWCKDFLVVMEISKTGRIHFHCTLQVNKPKELVSYVGYLQHCKTLHCKIELDTVDNVTLRTLYCLKDGDNILRRIYKGHFKPEPEEVVELPSKVSLFNGFIEEMDP